MRAVEAPVDFMAGCEDFDPITLSYPSRGGVAAPLTVRGPEPEQAPTRGNGPARRATAGANDATPKQLAFLRSLLVDLDAGDPDAAVAGFAAKLDRRGISKAIDELLVAVKAKRAATKRTTSPVSTTVVPDGMHGVDGRIFKVQTARTSGKPYAKELVGTSFEYAPGAIKLLSADTVLSIEAAAAFGKRTGTCCCCARTLTDPKSIDAGIGPICASRGWEA